MVTGFAGIQLAVAISMVSPGSGPPPASPLGPDVRARIVYSATVMGMRVGDVVATIGEVVVDGRGREVRHLRVTATGSRSLDALVKIRADLSSTVDARTLAPLTSSYKAVRGKKEWSAFFHFEDGRVRIDTVYKKRRWRRWRWVEAGVQDPLSWMLQILARPIGPKEKRSIAVLTRRRYLRMHLDARGATQLSTAVGKFKAVASYATFERWYPTVQLAHGLAPKPRKKKVMEAAVWWGMDGLGLPLRLEMVLSKVGAVSLDVIERKVERIAHHAQVLKSAHARRAATLAHKRKRSAGSR